MPGRSNASNAALYIYANHAWFADMSDNTATVLKGLGHQFARGGTDALKTPTSWDVPEIKMAGGVAALRDIGPPPEMMHAAKGRLFGVCKLLSFEMD